MWKLICYEWKKLAKSRSNLLLFVVLLAACAYQIKTNVTTDIKDYYFVSDEHLDVVKEQQNFANKSFEELQKQMGAIHYNEIDQEHYNSSRSLDENYMKVTYGTHWKELVKAYEEHTLTQEMLNDWNVMSQDDTQQQSIVRLEDFTIHYLYTDEREVSDLKAMFPDTVILTNRQDYLYTKEKAEQGSTQCFLKECNGFNAMYYDTLNTRFLNASKTYHPTILANKYFDEIMRVNFLVLLLISILLGNIYSKESSEQTMIYLCTSKAGWKKVSITKLIVALTIGVLIPMLIPIISSLVNYLRYGGFDLQMFYYGIGDVSANSIVPYIFTNGELLIIVCFALLVGYTALTLTCLTISRYVKNTYIAGVSVLMLTILPIYNIFTLQSTNLNVWFPSYLLMRIFDNLGYTSQLFFQFGSITILRLWLYVLVWFLGCGICLLLIHQKNKKHLI